MSKSHYTRNVGSLSLDECPSLCPLASACVHSAPNSEELHIRPGGRTVSRSQPRTLPISEMSANAEHRP